MNIIIGAFARLVQCAIGGTAYLEARGRRQRSQHGCHCGDNATRVKNGSCRAIDGRFAPSLPLNKGVVLGSCPRERHQLEQLRKAGGESRRETATRWPAADDLVKALT